MEAARVLQQPVLVLNRNWSPLHLCPTKEAIGLVAKGAARIIEPGTFAVHDLVTWNDASKAKVKFGDAVIRSKSLALVPPEVILLTAYAGQGERSVTFSRKNLFKRDRFSCCYCGTQPGPENLTVDHVVPRAKGGTSSWENCVLACVACNKRKADRTLAQAKMKLRKQPVKPSWKMLARFSPSERRESWDAFISRSFWEVELES